MEDKKLLCKQDYDSAKAKGKHIKVRILNHSTCFRPRFMFPISAADYGDGVDGNKRPRTTITARQMEVRHKLRDAFRQALLKQMKN